MFWEGSTINRDELPLLTGAVVVDRLRNQLLPSAALPDDEHIAIAGKHAGDRFTELVHCGCSTDQIFESISPLHISSEPVVLGAHISELPCVLNRDRSLARE